MEGHSIAQLTDISFLSVCLFLINQGIAAALFFRRENVFDNYILDLVEFSTSVEDVRITWHIINMSRQLWMHFQSSFVSDKNTAFHSKWLITLFWKVLFSSPKRIWYVTQSGKAAIETELGLRNETRHRIHHIAIGY